MSEFPKEHDYIAQLITDHWEGQIKSQLYPLQDEARQRLLNGDFPGAVVLEEQVKHLAQKLTTERMNAEDRRAVAPT